MNREILGALPCRDHLEAAQTAPIDEFAGQGRLVAVGHRVHDAGSLGFARQQRPGQHVGLDVHHDDVLALAHGLPGMGHARRRVSGCLDHHVNVVRRNQGAAVPNKPGARHTLRFPADRSADVPRPLRVEVGNHADRQAFRGRHLRQEHRAELAGADQADAHGALVL